MHTIYEAKRDLNPHVCTIYMGTYHQGDWLLTHMHTWGICHKTRGV